MLAVPLDTLYVLLDFIWEQQKKKDPQFIPVCLSQSANTLFCSHLNSLCITVLDGGVGVLKYEVHIEKKEKPDSLFIPMCLLEITLTRDQIFLTLYLTLTCRRNFRQLSLEKWN